MEQINKIFYDDYKGLLSFNRLWNIIKEKKLITKKLLYEWYKKQAITQIFDKKNIKIPEGWL
jgi:hypothetical protein